MTTYQTLSYAQISALDVDSRYSSRGSSSLTDHNNIRLMFFSDYSEFLDPDQDLSGFGGLVKTMGRSDAQYLAELTARHDLAYSEFTSIISKRLVAQPYPLSFQNTNPYCPLCLRLVLRSSAFTTCFINDERNYLIHQDCLASERGYELRNVGEIVKSEISVQEGKMEQIRKMDQKCEMRQFYIEIALTHPINDKNFIKLTKKVNLSHGHFRIAFDQEDVDSYFPNIILLPMTDYHLTLTCAEVGNKTVQVKMTKYLTFKQIKDRIAVLSCEQVQMEVEPINNAEQRKRLAQIMNYKCRHDNDKRPFIRIHAFKIAIYEEIIQSEEQCMLGSSSTIVEELLNQKEGSISTIRTSEHSPAKYSRLLTDSNSSNETEIEKINLVRLISTNTLIDFVKSSAHSRQFQSFLEQCNEHELLQIIINLREKLIELITHEYGNYMMQKLFAVCKPLQRLQLLELVIPSLCEVARNKQGTHTIQAFLDHLTLSEEYSLVSMQIAQNFYSLSCHSNATHFIQKIVKNFPLEYTIAYFHYITAHLMTFALDKNGMCVVKHMMRRLRELEGKQAVYDQAIDLVRRQLIFNVTFNVDQLIVDSYGNYVIQFCYELFDLDKCSGITERIISHFPHYALAKYSASVLLKCISVYWTDRRIFLSLRGLSNNQILELFRSKDGNRILLELMERQEVSELWERIYSILVQVEPTKYYHDRWGVCLGCRSGQAGTRLTSFPEAKKKTYTKKC